MTKTKAKAKKTRKTKHDKFREMLDALPAVIRGDVQYMTRSQLVKLYDLLEDFQPRNGAMAAQKCGGGIRIIRKAASY